MGYAKPKQGIASSARDNVKAMGKRLVSEQIPYNVPMCIKAPDSAYYDTSKTWIYPYDITASRCDGVVEYCFEYYGFKIGYANSSWDITRATIGDRTAHVTTNVTPKRQYQVFMNPA